MNHTDLRDMLPATARQKITLTRLYMATNNRHQLEQDTMSFGEAGREIRALIKQLTIYKRR